MKRINISSGSEYEKPIGFSRAVRIGNIISIVGTAPIAQDGTTAHPNDLYNQTIRCLEIMKKAIIDAGGQLENVIRTRIFLRDIPNGRRQLKLVENIFLRYVLHVLLLKLKVLSRMTG